MADKQQELWDKIEPLVDRMTGIERAQFFGMIFDKYCKACYADHPHRGWCSCENDE
ncbi:MAG: hypothetical protein ACXABY_14635 [Candidatus Thorarchaeota archaeon]|jgi:hypothetical protein